MKRNRLNFSGRLKISIKFLLVLSIVALAGFRVEAGLEPRLRTTVATDSDMITLGDLFVNAGTYSPTPILASPRPGKSLYIDTGQIAATLRAVGLNWTMPQNLTRVLVSRNGTRIPIQNIVAAIDYELQRNNAGSKFEIKINERKSELFVPANGDPTVIVEGLDRDIRSGNFVAQIFLPGARPGDQRVRIPGRVSVVTQVPVLLHRVPIGDEISENDLGWTEIAEVRAIRGLVQDPRDLIGLSPRRRIQPHVPIKFRDVQKPLLIYRGKLVNMIVQTPYMRLSTTGKALDSGALGDTVRVQNTSSRQIIQAVVDARNRVRVLTQSKLVVNQ